MSGKASKSAARETPMSCSDLTRGAAARARENMKDRKEFDREKYIKLSACVHCKTSNSDCPHSTAARPYLSK